MFKDKISLPLDNQDIDTLKKTMEEIDRQIEKESANLAHIKRQWLHSAQHMHPKETQRYYNEQWIAIQEQIDKLVSAKYHTQQAIDNKETF